MKSIIIKIKTFLSLCLCFTLTLTQFSALTLADEQRVSPIGQAMESLFGKEMSIREQTGCEIYLAPTYYQLIDAKTQTSIENGRFQAGENNIPATAVRWPQNSSGYRVSQSHELTDLKTGLVQLLEQLGKEALEGELVVTNAPMPLFNEFVSDFKNEVEKLFEELDLDPNRLKVNFTYQPSSQGFKRLIEDYLHWWPQVWPQLKIPFTNIALTKNAYIEDYDPPIGVETKKAVPIVISSELPTAATAIAGFWGQPQVYVPLIVGHFILLSAVVAYSRTLANWINRTEKKYHNPNLIKGVQKQFSLFLKQVIFSALFVGNFKIWGHSSEIAQFWSDSSSLEFMQQALSEAWNFTTGEEGHTTLIQSVYYHLTFNNGIFKWEGERLQNPDTQEMARNTKAVLTGLLYMIGGPVLLWATMAGTGDNFLGLNGGQIGLLVMTGTLGAFFSYSASKNPELIDNYVSPFVINKIGPPLNWFALGMRKIVEPPMQFGFKILDGLSRILRLKKSQPIDVKED
ncbi:MAG: hypothetical protein KDD40_10890 [Bdellovibrionales bacterium]|nr:hypothetical protein [Bdellovibrionales bacterium]